MRILFLVDEAPAAAAPTPVSARLHGLIRRLQSRGFMVTVVARGVEATPVEHGDRGYLSFSGSDLAATTGLALRHRPADVIVAVGCRMSPPSLPPLNPAIPVVFYEHMPPGEATATPRSASEPLYAVAAPPLLRAYRALAGVGGLVLPPVLAGDQADAGLILDRFELLLMAAKPRVAAPRGRIVDIVRPPQQPPAMTPGDVGRMRWLQQQIARVAGADAEALQALAGRYSTGNAATARRMARALGVPMEPQAQAFARRAAANREECILQCLKAYSRSGWHPPIVTAGRRHIDAALAQGRGAILWVVHSAFASNIVKMAIHGGGFRLSQISRPEHGLSSSAFGMSCLNRVRTDFEDRFLVERIRVDRRRPTASMLAARAVLRRNELIAFTAGDFEGTRAVELPFAGGALRLATGPLRLGMMTGAPVLPVSGVRRSTDGIFEVRIEAPLDLARTADETATLLAASTTFAGYIARTLIRYPTQLRGWSSLAGGGEP